MSDTLAIHGGSALRKKAFAPYNTIGQEEIDAVHEVMKGGVLSAFVGAPVEAFHGGLKVLELEKNWSEYFSHTHSISMNSATSALYAAIGAIGIEPGDEVIVPPYTMSATAMAPLVYGGIPVFADIDPITYCIDAKSVLQKITSKTKAIIVVNLFGQCANYEELREIADKHHLKIIEDNAQAAGAFRNSQSSGSFGDIGVYSLNCYKNIQCGEGGIAVTEDDELAYKLKLIRNHAESVVANEDWPPKELKNMVGFNYRLSELHAAIAIEQLKKLKTLNEQRVQRVLELNDLFSDFDALKTPPVDSSNTHVYYVQALSFDAKKAGCSRELFLEALKAEGVTLSGGYVKPLYLLPVFQNKLAFGKDYPFSYHASEKALDYQKGLCPVCESCYEEKLIVNTLIYPPLTSDDLLDIHHAIEKVLSHSAQLNPSK